MGWKPLPRGTSVLGGGGEGAVTPSLRDLAQNKLEKESRRLKRRCCLIRSHLAAEQGALERPGAMAAGGPRGGISARAPRPPVPETE